jgi:NADH:ubiquinone oxidoreductase subunit
LSKRNGGIGWTKGVEQHVKQEEWSSWLSKRSKSIGQTRRIEQVKQKEWVKPEECNQSNKSGKIGQIRGM